MSIEIRAAAPGDGAILHGMIRELAVNHGAEKYFTASPEDFERMLADPRGIGGALIAFLDGAPAGCATWQRMFSTFRGRETVYLEDLSVLPQFRRRGVGQALLKAMARLALERGTSRLHWLMMAWNEEGRRLYAAAGAAIEDGNCFCTLEGAALERLAS
jgi:GNAT superfamily N-acetyltransferase